MNPYEILGIKREASLAEIKSAYRKLSKECHPDSSTGNDTMFMELNLAYKVLSDKQKRAIYDETGTVMDEPANHINDLVQSRMGGLTEKWLKNMIKGNAVPLKEFAIGGIERGIDKLSNANDEILETIIELKNIREKLIHKDGEALIHKIIDEKIKHHNSLIIQNKQEVVVMKKLIKVIEKYDFETDEADETITISLFRNGTSASGFGGVRYF